MYEFLTIADSYDFILRTICSNCKCIKAFVTLCPVDLPFAAPDLLTFTIWHHVLFQWNIEQLS